MAFEKLTNTSQRIISALVLALLVIGVITSGQGAAFGLLTLLAVIIQFEIAHSFFHWKFTSQFSLASQFFLILLMIFFYWQLSLGRTYVLSLGLGVGFLNFALMLFLFFARGVSLQNWLSRQHPLTLSLILVAWVVLPFACLTQVLFVQNWQRSMAEMLLLTYLTDTAAWFFGKNFGKRPLWPAVSPKKTWEGAIGGVSATMFFAMSYFYAQERLSAILVCLLLIVICFSQIGDLLESKLKRLFGVKDTSEIIPGHGGVYDRLDSLLFISPFFLLVLEYLSSVKP